MFKLNYLNDGLVVELEGHVSTKASELRQNPEMEGEWTVKDYLEEGGETYRTYNGTQLDWREAFSNWARRALSWAQDAEDEGQSVDASHRAFLSLLQAAARENVDVSDRVRWLIHCSVRNGMLDLYDANQAISSDLEDSH